MWAAVWLVLTGARQDATTKTSPPVLNGEQMSQTVRLRVISANRDDAGARQAATGEASSPSTRARPNASPTPLAREKHFGNLTTNLNELVFGLDY